MRKLVTLLQRLSKKPLDVIVFRAYQEILQFFFHRLRIWQRLESSATKTCGAYNRLILINKDLPILEGNEQKKAKQLATKIVLSDFEIFGVKVPNLRNCEWNRDWRFNKTWENNYYKNYSFYEKKKEPYDVKFAWELARLFYLVPVLSYGAFDQKFEETAIKFSYDLLTSWRSKNPMAHSVNWYPMEASMRIIYFVQMLDFVVYISRRDRSDSTQDSIERLKMLLIKLIHEHAIFVWHNREFTDVRGNHFTANLVGLFLAGLVCESFCKKANRWRDYAIRWLDTEVLLQFHNDGVNFEKSNAYHKLVLEMFYLAMIARDSVDSPFSKTAKERLSRATDYLVCSIRPDGRTANFGDTDSAVAIAFEFEDTRSNLPLALLLGGYFSKRYDGHCFDVKNSSIPKWLYRAGSGSPNEIPLIGEFYFSDGGYLIIRQLEGFFMIDLGEVGMLGRGGHGHNDLGSFELYAKNKAIIVDPGCPGYTSDLQKKDMYRSTMLHNVANLDENEMASLIGPWRISNDALSEEIGYSKKSNGDYEITFSHRGYERIYGNGRITRRIYLSLKKQHIVITDSTDHLGWSQLRQNFHLGPAVKYSQDIVVKTTTGVKDVCSYLYSDCYGQEAVASKISIVQESQYSNKVETRLDF